MNRSKSRSRSNKHKHKHHNDHHSSKRSKRRSRSRNSRSPVKYSEKDIQEKVVLEKQQRDLEAIQNQLIQA